MLIHRNRFTRITLLLLMFAIVACDKVDDKETKIMNTINLSNWENKMHITFPENTITLGLIENLGMDEIVYLKVSIPKYSWKDFIGSSLLHLEDMDNEKRFFLGTDNEWWNPSEPVDLPTAQASLPDGSIVNIGVDLSKASDAIIYLMWHEK